MAGGGVRRPDRAAAGEPRFRSLAPRSRTANCSVSRFVVFAGGLMCRLGPLGFWLQLDFDGGAPPEQAWRRKLNSHANRLKEFSITFMEAMRMVWVSPGFGSPCSVFCDELRICWC